jgi:hypothetical protein
VVQPDSITLSAKAIAAQDKALDEEIMVVTRLIRKTPNNSPCENKGSKGVKGLRGL